MYEIDDGIVICWGIITKIMDPRLRVLVKLYTRVYRVVSPTIDELGVMVRLVIRAGVTV